MSHSGPSAVAITLSEAERAELVRRTTMPHRRSAEKARIILACADGMSNAGVARLVGVQAKTVGKWRRAFAAERMAGLEDTGWIGRPKADLILDDAERRQLQQWARQAKTAQFLALRAKIVLRCAEGGTNQQAAADLGIDRSTVDRWQARFITKRLDGLQDEPRSGRPPSWAFSILPAVPVYWRWTPTVPVPFFTSPVSSTTNTARSSCSCSTT